MKDPNAFQESDMCMNFISLAGWLSIENKNKLEVKMEGNNENN